MSKPGDIDPFEVTPDDHDAGFKVVPVQMKRGETVQVKLTAPPWREGIELVQHVLLKSDPWAPLIKCLPADLPENWLDRVSPMCIPQLLGVAWALTGGDGFQKKMAEAGKMWLDLRILTTADAPNSL